MTTATTLPKYQQIFDTLRAAILDGEYGPGEKLPTEAVLVKQFKTSRITVGKAVRELQREGLVHRQAGSGTFVSEAATDARHLSFGLLIPDFGQTEIFNPICHGMASAPHSDGHSLIWCHSENTDEPGQKHQEALRVCRQLIERKVDGVFFAPFEQVDTDGAVNREITSLLDKARIPVVLLDRDISSYPSRSRYDLVGIDNRRVGFAVTDHLLSLGRKRIVFLTYREGVYSIGERINGYREAVSARGLPADSIRVEHLPAENEEATRVIKSLLESFRPDAFVCVNDRTAGGLMHHLLSSGVRIPEDVAVVGIDDVAYANLLPVRLTTMHQPCGEIGRTAVAAMLERIRNPGMTARTLLLDCHLVIRKSCGAESRSPHLRAAF
ncbi:MAG: GntR family transcriptional regulator [Verrucomicrobiales bacterium]|nr:GntR family transcriptional regulator [Verrucomicrobiales bacterium]